VFGIDGTIKSFNIIAGAENIGRYEPSLTTDLNLKDTSLSGACKALDSITADSSVTVSGTAVFETKLNRS